MKKKLFISFFTLFVCFSFVFLKAGDDCGQKIWEVYKHCDDPCPSIGCIRGGTETCLIKDHCPQELKYCFE